MLMGLGGWGGGPDVSTGCHEAGPWGAGAGAGTGTAAATGTPTAGPADCTPIAGRTTPSCVAMGRAPTPTAPCTTWPTGRPTEPWPGPRGRTPGWGRGPAPTAPWLPTIIPPPTPGPRGAVPVTGPRATAVIWGGRTTAPPPAYPAWAGRAGVCAGYGWPGGRAGTPATPRGWLDAMGAAMGFCTVRAGGARSAMYAGKVEGMEYDSSTAATALVVNTSDLPSSPTAFRLEVRRCRPTEADFIAPERTPRLTLLLLLSASRIKFHNAFSAATATKVANLSASSSTRFTPFFLA